MGGRRRGRRPVRSGRAGRAALAALVAAPLFVLLAPLPAAPRAAAAPAGAAYAGAGYQVVLPAGWAVRQRTALALEVRRPDGLAALTIYTQPLGTKTFAEYVSYSNKFVLTPRGALTVLSMSPEADWPAGRPGGAGGPGGAGPVPLPLAPGADLASIDWLRPPVSADDLNRFREFNVGVAGVCYTFVLRAGEDQFPAAAAALDAALLTFAPEPLPADPEGEWLARRAPSGPAAGLPAAALPAPVFRWAAHQSLRVQLPSSGLVWGMFDGHAPFELDPLAELEVRLGRRIEFVMTYRDFSAPFPLAAVRAAAQQGRLCMITWQPHFISDPEGPPLIPAIAAGQYDQYIREWAGQVREFGQPVLLRFANEMNGDWDPWCVFYYGFDHDLFVRAWRRVHDIFTAAGAVNAMWVWNPHDRSYPGFAWNDPHLYYPAGRYVDWVGMTGYNTGPRAGDPWRSFDDIYRPVYDRYRVLYPQKPLLITEFACDSEGGDKAAWIADALQSFKDYPAVRMAVWFNYPWWRWEYELDKPPEAFEALRAGLWDPYFCAGAVHWWNAGP